MHRDAADPKSERRADVLQSESERMRDVLEGLLNAGRPVVAIERSPTHVTELVDSVVRAHEGLASPRRIRLSYDAPRSLVAIWDHRKIAQVLANLVSNAIDAVPDGASVSVAVSTLDGDIQITVEDTGPGLEAGVAGRVFEPGVTTKGPGSGHGLTVARMFVEQHEGTLTLEDRPTGGCRATLILPPHVQVDA